MILRRNQYPTDGGQAFSSPLALQQGWMTIFYGRKHPVMVVGQFGTIRAESSDGSRDVVGIRGMFVSQKRF